MFCRSVEPTFPSVVTIIINPMAIPDSSNSSIRDAISVNPLLSPSVRAPELFIFRFPIVLFPIVSPPVILVLISTFPIAAPVPTADSCC